MNIEDDIMTDILIGSYVGLTTLLMVNIFIALLTSTFTRVHDSSKAYFILQRAIEIVRIENKLDPINKYKHLVEIGKDYIDKAFSSLREINDTKNDAFDAVKDSIKVIKEEVTDLTEKLDGLQAEIVKLI